MNAEKKDLIKRTGEKAVQYRCKGFHCSESTFRAVNDVFHLVEPDIARIITGFHGGGGARRKDSSVDLNAVLLEVAAGRDQRPPEELPVETTGHLCGALAAGIAAFGILYGRLTPEDDLTTVDEMSFELHRRFIQEFGTRECSALREKWIPLREEHNCDYTYRWTAETIAEMILDSKRV